MGPLWGAPLLDWAAGSAGSPCCLSCASPSGTTVSAWPPCWSSAWALSSISSAGDPLASCSTCGSIWVRKGSRREGGAGRAKLCRGAGEWGRGGDLGCQTRGFLLQGSRDGTPVSMGAAARSACYLPRDRPPVQRRGRRWVDGPDRYPGAGRCIPSPPPPPHLERSAGVCVRVGVYSGLTVCGEAKRRDSLSLVL